MPFTEVFGGQATFPSQLLFLEIDVSAANVTLQWPVEQAPAGQLVVPDIAQISSTVAARSITMPDARIPANGTSVLFNNVGAETISVLGNLGATLLTVASGECWMIYLEDNLTQAGVWRVFQFGAGASSANAAALAGAGLKAITTTLNVQITPEATAVTPTDLVAGDRAKIKMWTGGVGTFNLPDPAVVGSDWFVYIRNAGSGNLTLVPPSGTINGGVNLVFGAGDSAIVLTDGTDFFTIGFGRSIAAVFDFTSINVAGTGAYTLTGGELNRVAYRFTGALTGNREIEVPASVQQYWVDNQTSGAFTLTVKTSAGTGVIVGQGQARILYCDGTNVVEAEETWINEAVQGDVPYASGTGVIARLAKSILVTRYLSNQGTDNNPSWSQVNLANGVTGLLPFANLADGSALSVLGRPSNTAGVMESIPGGANLVLRVNSAGTILAFGAVNLAAGGIAVTGNLPPTNGGTGLGTYAQGDILYASAANTLARLAKSATDAMFLENSGVDNDPAWQRIRFSATDVTVGKTFSLGDRGSLQLHTDAGADTLEIDTNANVEFPPGTVIPIFNAVGAGVLTIDPLPGVVLYVKGVSVASFDIPAGYGGFLMQGPTVNVWVLVTDAPQTAGVGATYALTWDGSADAGDFAVTDDTGGVYTITHNLGLSNVYGLAISGIVLNATSNTDSAIHTTGVPGANSFVIERFSNDTRAAGPFSLVMRRVAA